MTSNYIFFLLLVFVLLQVVLAAGSSGKKENEKPLDEKSFATEAEARNYMKELNQKKKTAPAASENEDDELSEADRKKFQREEFEYRRKLEIVREENGKMSSEYVDTLHRLGRAVYKQRKFNDVFAIAKEIVKIHEKIDGPEHINTAKALTNVGSTANRLKNMKECDLAMNRALYIFIKNYGDNSKEVFPQRKCSKDFKKTCCNCFFSLFFRLCSTEDK
jgi:Skp family chaperone for outer membrane proteins